MVNLPLHTPPSNLREVRCIFMFLRRRIENGSIGYDSLTTFLLHRVQSFRHKQPRGHIDTNANRTVLCGMIFIICSLECIQNYEPSTSGRLHRALYQEILKLAKGYLRIWLQYTHILYGVQAHTYENPRQKKPTTPNMNRPRRVIYFPYSQLQQLKDVHNIHTVYVIV